MAYDVVAPTVQTIYPRLRLDIHRASASYARVAIETFAPAAMVGGCVLRRYKHVHAAPVPRAALT
jgi:hypothetical protein